MSMEGMDVDTAETLAGAVQMLRRPAELVWAAAVAVVVESHRQVLGSKTPDHGGSSSMWTASPDMQPNPFSQASGVSTANQQDTERSRVPLISARKPTDLSGGRALTTAGRKMIMPRLTVKSEVAPIMYRVDEAAAALRLSRSSVYELIRSGQLRTVKQGRRRLVPVAALAEYAASLGGAT